MYWFLAFTWWIMLLLPPLVLDYRRLPDGQQCPTCGTETLAVRTALLRPVRRWLTCRWCMYCGWYGLARRWRGAHHGAAADGIGAV